MEGLAIDSRQIESARGQEGSHMPPSWQNALRNLEIWMDQMMSWIGVAAGAGAGAGALAEVG